MNEVLISKFIKISKLNFLMKLLLSFVLLIELTIEVDSSKRFFKNRSFNSEKITVVKPLTDYREYLVEKLSNGLEVIYVQDELSPMCYGNMLIKYGAFDAPQEFPGLAHFIEHMLFLGNDEYKKPLESYKKLNQYKMNFNGMTVDDLMTITFEIHKNGFFNSLEMLAASFKGPLFDVNQMEKEMNNFNNEYMVGYKFNQIAHQYMVSLYNPPYNVSFGGNSTWLLDEPLEKGVDIQNRYKDIYKSQFTADKMKLIVYCKGLIKRIIA